MSSYHTPELAQLRINGEVKDEPSTQIFDTPLVLVQYISTGGRNEIIPTITSNAVCSVHRHYLYDMEITERNYNGTC